MKLFVTGGAGFIGSNFIRYYLAEHPDDQIINFDLLTYAGNLANISDILDPKRHVFVKGDIRRADQLRAAMAGCEVVVHFAAESHNDRANIGPELTVQTNVLGTQVLLEAARQLEVSRFHHISTDEVFGHIPLDENWKFSESTPYYPRSVYPASKAGSDHLVRAYNIAFGLPTTITNCSNNYGPYQYPEKLIPLAITNLIEGKKIPVYGDGLQVRDWLYVEDHCRAIDLVLHKGTVGETYLVGGMTELIPNIELVKRLIKLVGKDQSSIDFVADRPGHDRKYDVDWSKINRELGWKPLHSFDEWLEKTVKWYQDNQDWWKPLKRG